MPEDPAHNREPELEADIDLFDGEIDLGLPPASVALAHDWLVGYRGGEAVLDRIARLVESEIALREPMIYTMFDDGQPLTPALDALPRTVSFLNRLPLSKRARRWLLPLYPTAVRGLSKQLVAAQQSDQSRIDLLISTSSAAIHGLTLPADSGVPHICYCHTPARYLWSQSDQYASGLRGLGLSLFAPSLRDTDRQASKGVTHWIANSAHTQSEISRCFGRESRVIHPPVRTDFFTPAASGDSASTSTLPSLPDRFLLAAGALEPYKRFDLAIHAAQIAGLPLVIAGNGSQRAKLESLAREANSHGGSSSDAPTPNVTFLGRVTDEQLRELFRRAEMLLFPQIEDFGITAVEAQACGTPVVAFAKGGAIDTVIPNVTGALFQDQTAEALAAAIAACPSKPACTQACRQNAERFAESVFDQQMLGMIQSALAERR